jgi:hypothetical protein
MAAEQSAIERFVAKCRFDPGTGCVLWTGGQTSGRGHSAPYGAFWFEGRRWFAHRWAALHIHGLDIEYKQVDHCCPNIPKPDTLCVQHLQALPAVENRELQTLRQRQYWLLVGKGFEPPPGVFHEPETRIPFFGRPQWMLDFPR